MGVDNVRPKTVYESTNLCRRQHIMKDTMRPSGFEVEVVQVSPLQGSDQYVASLTAQFGGETLGMKRTAFGQKENFQRLRVQRNLPNPLFIT